MLPCHKKSIRHWLTMEGAGRRVQGTGVLNDSSEKQQARAQTRLQSIPQPPTL